MHQLPRSLYRKLFDCIVARARGVRMRCVVVELAEPKRNDEWQQPFSLCGRCGTALSVRRPHSQVESA